MSKIKGMKKQKDFESAVKALKALVDHLEEMGGTASLYQNVAKGQIELFYLFDGKTADKSSIISMVNDYVMLLEKVALLEKGVSHEV